MHIYIYIYVCTRVTSCNGELNVLHVHAEGGGGGGGMMIDE